MTNNISRRDWEALSAYLDGELAPKDRARLENRLQTSADLRLALKELRRTRTVLRSQPPLRAPRNFTLSSQMVGVRQAQPRGVSLFSFMRFASAMAGILLVLVLLGDFLLGGSTAAGSRVAMAPSSPIEAPAVKLAPEISSQEAAEASQPAATEQSLQALSVPQVEGTPWPTEAPAAGGEPNSTLGSPPSAAAAIAPTETPDKEAQMLSEPTPALQQLSPESTASDRSSLTAQAYPTPAAGQAAQGGWSIWRVLEVLLASLAVITGIAAFYLRRAGHL